MHTPIPLSIGIDVSDRTAQVCVLNHSGIVEEFKIVLDERSLRERIPLADHAVVVIETGTRSAWIKRVLTAAGMKVIVADARKLRAISGNPYKTDRNDARTLARLGLSDLILGPAAGAESTLLTDTYVRPVEHQAHYDLLRMRDMLVRRRGDFIRLVRSIVKGTGRTLRKVEAERFTTLRSEVAPSTLVLVEPMMAAIEATTRSIDTLDAQLAEVASGYRDVLRLDGISGVGPVTALAFYVVIGDPSRFRSVRSVGAYLGMVVKRDQSGRQDPKLGISKAGNGFVRRLLLQCANQILGPFGADCALRRWGLSFIAANGDRSKKKARVAVARRLAVQMLAIWKKQEDWQAFPDQAENSTPTPEPVVSDDCAATPVAIEHAEREIAASPTDRTQPCTRATDTRADESGERRRGSGVRRQASRNPRPVSAQGPAYPSSRAELARAGAPAAPCAPPDHGCRSQQGGRVEPGPGPETKDDPPRSGRRAARQKDSRGTRGALDEEAAS